MSVSLLISAVSAMAWLFFTGAPALADVTIADYLALQRCLHCIETGCRTDSTPFPNIRESTVSSGASRNVETYTFPAHKEVVAYPDLATRDELTGQDIFTFSVDEDVTIMGASPPPRLHGAAGFWAFASGTPYFCPTSQIGSVWNGPDNGSSFKFLLAPMTKVRGVRLRRYPRDGSLAEVWGMDNSELQKWTPTLKCEKVIAPNEKVQRNNAYYALADAIRFGVVHEALRTCKRSFLNERNVFLNNVQWGCVNPKIPFQVNLMAKINEARGYMDKNEWSDNCCARKFDDTFIRRFGRGGLADNYATPVCPKLDGGAPAPASAPAASESGQIPAQ